LSEPEFSEFTGLSEYSAFKFNKTSEPGFPGLKDLPQEHKNAHLQTLYQVCGYTYFQDEIRIYSVHSKILKILVQTKGITLSETSETPNLLRNTLSQHCETPKSLGNTLSQHCETLKLLGNILSQHCETSKSLGNILSQHCETPKSLGNILSQHCETPKSLRNTLSQHCETLFSIKKHKKRSKMP
jgi:hypothetical protein